MILIIGATGTVGKEVIRILSPAGITAKAFTRNRERAATLLPHDVHIMQGELDDVASLKTALNDVSRLLLITPSDPQQVSWERNVISAAAESGIRRIVKLSTLGANPDSSSLIARWHGQSEANLKSSGIPYTILRCHNFMQNTLAFAPSIAAEGAFYAPLADAKIAMVDARDIAEVAVKVLTEESHRGRIYRLTGAEAVSYHRVADLLSEAIGREVKYQSITLRTAKENMIEKGFPSWEVEELLNLYVQFRQGGGERVWNDIPDILGKPARSFAQFVKDYAYMFRGDF